MRTARIFSMLLLSLALAGTFACQTKRFRSDASIDSDYDFSKIDTFAVVRVQEKVLASPNGRIAGQAIRESLEKRGYEEVPEDQADVWVSYDLGTFAATRLSWGSGHRGEGRLIFRVIDPKTGREVYYGWVEGKLRTTPDPENSIRQAVEELLSARVPEVPED